MNIFFWILIAWFFIGILAADFLGRQGPIKMDYTKSNANTGIVIGVAQIVLLILAVTVGN